MEQEKKSKETAAEKAEEKKRKTNLWQEKIYIYALQNAIEHKGKAISSSVLNKLFSDGLQKKEIKKVILLINETIDKVNKIGLKKQQEEYANFGIVKEEKKQRIWLPQLENVEKGKVVLRFAPFPSGALHIGNTRQAILNDEYAKFYKGKLFLVYDDTIGGTATGEGKNLIPEAYKLIYDGLKWLNVKIDKIIYKSDRFPIYYKYAQNLIELGAAYVCNCSTEKVRKNRAEGIECACRQYPVKNQLERWKKMFNAKEGQFTLRLKTNMQHPNPAFRDRILFRISEKKHPKIGNKYKVWPLLEFSWAIDDILLGISHVIRGKDLMMETEVEEFIWKIFNWKKPVIIHTGLFEIKGLKLSKTKGQKEVITGSYIGWHDPRTWSLQSLYRRGIQAESIRKFMISLGLTKGETTVPIESLYSENRKLVEKSKRYFFVKSPVKIKIENAPKIKTSIRLHPDFNYGERKFSTADEFYIADDDYKLLKKGGSFRLMHLLNFETSKFYEEKSGEELQAEFISKEKDEKLKSKLLHWLPADKENISKLCKVEIRMPDGIIKKGYAESDVKNVKSGEIIQFERFGFCRLEKKWQIKGKDVYEFWFAHR